MAAHEEAFLDNLAVLHGVEAHLVEAHALARLWALRPS
jgi:hypothetical protein